MPRIQEVAYSFSLTGIHLPWKSTFKLKLQIKVGSSMCTLNISVLSCVLEDRCINPLSHCLDPHNRLLAHTSLIVLHECLGCWIFAPLVAKVIHSLACMPGRSEHWLWNFTHVSAPLSLLLHASFSHHNQHVPSRLGAPCIPPHGLCGRRLRHHSAQECSQPIPVPPPLMFKEHLKVEGKKQKASSFAKYLWKRLSAICRSEMHQRDMKGTLETVASIV